MPPGRGTGSERRASVDLKARLEERREELEQTALARVYGISDPTDVADPTYLEGLRTAVRAAVDYGLASIGSSDRNPPQPPPVLLVQARIAASSGISLDTVLRRYFAGYALLGDFVLEEALREDLRGDALKGLLRVQASIFDRLIAAVSEEYARESENPVGTTAERRAELVERLLAGERLDTSEIAYELDATHVALVAKGPAAEASIRELAAALDRRLLLVRRSEELVWAWLGGRRDLDHERVRRLLETILPSSTSLALGEPDEGTTGWRLSHRQAQAALPIALRGPEPFVRYADVALLASIVQDEVLATTLRQIYLAPLEEERDAGEMARETLRTYFAANRNVSSAAAALGVSRQAVARRLASIEARLDRSLSAHGFEIEAAIRLEELSATA